MRTCAYLRRDVHVVRGDRNLLLRVVAGRRRSSRDARKGSETGEGGSDEGEHDESRDWAGSVWKDEVHWRSAVRSLALWVVQRPTNGSAMPGRSMRAVHCRRVVPVALIEQR
jgi:hypothetical protein